MRYTQERHFQSKDETYDVWIYDYTTKSGYLKFHVQVFARCLNDSGFCTKIADYKTEDNSLIRYLEYNETFRRIK